IQTKYNTEHGITPKTIVKDVRDIIEISSKDDTQDRKSFKKLSKPERDKIIRKLSTEMKEAARMLEFEQAAFLRDKIKELRGEGTGVEEKPKTKKASGSRKRKGQAS
ncbi:MAG: UvrB/UvrC motif-containing protein, partial [Ethanoligenens sp.]